MKKRSRSLRKFPDNWPYTNKHGVVITKRELEETSGRVLKIAQARKLSTESVVRILLWALDNVNRPGLLEWFSAKVVISYARPETLSHTPRAPPRLRETEEGYTEESELADLRETYDAVFGRVVPLEKYMRSAGSTRIRQVKKIKDIIERLSDEEKDALGYPNLGKDWKNE